MLVDKNLVSILISIAVSFFFFIFLLQKIGAFSSNSGYIFDWNTLLKQKTINVISEGFKNTLIISFWSLLLSLVFGLIISILKRSKILILKFIANTYTEIIIGTPLIVQVILFYYFLAPTIHLNSAFSVGIAILSAFYGAYVSEIFRSGIENIPKVQWESAESLGFNKFQQYIYIIIPQVIKSILPPLAGQFALVVKGSALLSVVGIAEVTKRYQELDALEFAPAEFYITLAFTYLIITIPISLITKYFEQKLKI